MNHEEAQKWQNCKFNLKKISEARKDYLSHIIRCNMTMLVKDYEVFDVSLTEDFESLKQREGSARILHDNRGDVHAE